MPPPKVQARFIEPMLLVRTETLPESDGLVFELKLDGFSLAQDRVLANGVRTANAASSGLGFV